MADVTPRDATRGQLIVVTGLVLAVLFVGLALVLNSGIYAENLSTRDAGEETLPAHHHLHVTTENIGELISEANAAVVEDDFVNVNTTFHDGFDHWVTVQTDDRALEGRSFDAEIVHTTQGTHARQTDYDRNLTAGGDIAGQANWTLASDATEAGEFELLLRQQSLLNATGGTLEALAGDAFNVRIETASGTWRVFVFRGAVTGNAYLLVETDGENFANDDTGIWDFTRTPCTYNGDDVPIDIRNGAWGDADDECDQLSFYEEEIVDAGTPHEIGYNNTYTKGTVDDLLDTDLTSGDRAEGTYSVIVDTESNRTPYHDPTTGKSPSANAIIYDATAEYRYESHRVVLEGDAVTARWEELE